MTLKLVFAAVLELVYAIAAKSWLPQYADGVQLELLKTVVRVASALAYWLLFRNVLLGREERPAASRNPLFALALLVLLLAPTLAGRDAHPDFGTKLVFGITSIVVGIREEFFYRGIVQNLLESRLGWMGAIAVSNVAFSLYHFGGAQPYTLKIAVELFAVGIFGLIYAGTGSLFVAIAVHAIYDAILSFTPLLSQPLSPAWGSAMQLMAFILCAVWAWRLRGSGPARRGQFV